MSYKYETQHNSPNFTSAADAPKVWGKPRTISAIAIHWWGDPNTNPSYTGVIATLVNPNRGASAHFVATGTNRSVAQLVNLSDASWATNSANPYTISIECDPRCRNEDYDVVAELIAQIRQVYGDLPLVPHRQFVATACPGNYDLNRLDSEARNKVALPEWNWGHVENKQVETTPEPTPDNLYRLIVDGIQRAAYSSEQNAYNGYRNYGGGDILLNGQNVTAAIVSKYAPVPEPEVPVTPVDPETPSEPTPPEVENPENSSTLWDDIVSIFKKLIEFLSKYKRSK